MEIKCIFCEIRDGTIKSEIIFQNDSCFVINDIEPKAPVHMLIIPKKHINLITEFSNIDFDIVSDLFKAISTCAKMSNTNNSGYRISINQGKNAGQMVDHLHLHLLGGNKLGAMV
ncbi:MAG: HIT domain-containing protein [Dehalococcoidia bacterium]|jgi:histidine triad (HIT) family protein|nr:HIT domain-containing protein [SAR202 cluster bacterium]GIS68369.1 MAG: histidine triad nucleotide-binding protein [Chloroflexota bacterium]|tara:strand:- start:12224 stop:12568 length:345 start_codon:yes stop_codon:yes gene_type:complete